MKITINLINKDWIQLRGTHYALEYLPDDFDSFHTLLTESQLQDSDELTRNWYSNYLDLMARPALRRRRRIARCR